MSMSQYRSSQVIAKSETEACEAWQTPSISDGGSTVDLPAAITESSIEAIRTKAQEEGFAKGYSEGIAAAQSEIKEGADAFRSVLQSLSEPLAMQSHQFEKEILSFAEALAKQIILHEVELNPKLLLPMIKDVLKQLPCASREVQVFLSPQVAKLIRNITSGQSEDLHCELLDDARLSYGDCRVSASSGQIDATLDERLESLLKNVVAEASKTPLQESAEVEETSAEAASTEAVSEPEPEPEPEQQQESKPADDTNAEKPEPESE